MKDTNWWVHVILSVWYHVFYLVKQSNINVSWNNQDEASIARAVALFETIGGHIHESNLR